jgi:hypothetical protein
VHGRQIAFEQPETTMARTIPVLGAALAALALASSCASSGPGPDERMSERLALFERHAGPPVDKFRFWDMKRFEVLGDYTVAVWTTIDDAWLITVMAPCTGLEYANSIGLSSTQRQVYQRFDVVQFDDQRCRIREIRSVDGRALDAEEDALRR